ncbi:MULTISPECIES: 5'/3'-nucleotidase SurE [Devosia]|jgi:5'-nucleotidase|uniref:5'-nucleotidase n=1 Tax=Devosia litorisediminis TaxID=2829817 RepID=A0A942E5L0_9HYPH|nr:MULTISPECIES: 5'/3'-nucleotidase SurE [Devosia]MBS3848668.1 5'/3'-nucleotidase SurE [Devosia litorisediminis]MCZ4346317.1 5'/3'-nucleotidase SurE [Devosia neptuniae]|tara:strand:+ start:963 stop:1730 length:768 start_codon:yes stop_codon:yes gene_type:complete
MGLRILITNDDGVDAPGIAIMADIARALSDDVWIVAPDGNQSGAGHRLSFGHELTIDQRDARTFAVVGGSPADCVVAGMTHLLGDRPADVVLSGVNAGQNLGDIVNCSGTAAGAREGAMQGAIGIAMSQGVDYEISRDVDWSNAKAHGLAAARAVIAAAQGREHYYNVNFPFCDPATTKGIAVVPLQRFSRSPFSYYPSDNAGKFFVAIPQTPLPLDRGADFETMRRDGYVTVTPLLLQQTDMGLAERLNGTLTL